jgi:hypothetical protein
MFLCSTVSFIFISFSVSFLFHFCFVSVSFLFRFCFVSVSFMFRLCFVYVSFLFRFCLVYVSFMFRLCFVYVSFLFHFCRVYVLSVFFVSVSLCFGFVFVFSSFMFHFHFIYVSFSFHYVSLISKSTNVSTTPETCPYPMNLITSPSPTESPCPLRCPLPFFPASEYTEDLYFLPSSPSIFLPSPFALTLHSFAPFHSENREYAQILGWISMVCLVFLLISFLMIKEKRKFPQNLFTNILLSPHVSVFLCVFPVFYACFLCFMHVPYAFPECSLRVPLSVPCVYSECSLRVPAFPACVLSTYLSSLFSRVIFPICVCEISPMQLFDNFNICLLHYFLFVC